MIYLDYAAATPTRIEVIKAMEPYWSIKFANPSSLHQFGKEMNNILETCRAQVLGLLNASSTDSMIITNSGTMSINIALQGLLKKDDNVITSKIEHTAVLETIRNLENTGTKATYLNVDSDGLIDIKELESAITKRTKLITIHSANNEIGVLQPIDAIGKIAKKHGVLLHVDACQYIPTDITNIDMLTLNGSKIYGPKGCGLLYVKKGIKIKRIIFGGNQEFGLFAGTQNLPAIVGLSKAMALYVKEKDTQKRKLTRLRDYFINSILTKIPNTYLNGHATIRLPNNINISFSGVESEILINHLSAQGIMASAGSACTSNEVKTSHVLEALPIAISRKNCAVRFSIGKSTTKKELDMVLRVLVKIVESLRKI